MSGRFEVYRDKSDLFRFRLLTDTGENILASESYREKRSAFNGIASIKKNCLIPDRCVKRKNIDEKLYFVLRAGNHEVIGKSGNFYEDSDLDAGIAKLVEIAPQAEVKDITVRKNRAK